MSLDLEIRWATEHVAKLAAAARVLEAENANLKAPWGTFVEYEPMQYGTKCGDINYYWQQYENSIAEDRARAERNAPKLTANNLLLKKLVDTIVATGISSTGSQWNGRKRKYESVTADWINMLRSAMPKLPGSLDDSERKHKENIKRREDEAKKKEASRLHAEQARVAEENERKKLARLVAVATQLGMPVTSEEGEVRTAILAKDKYLDLAVAGMACRSDWSDGCGVVISALRRFHTETPEDHSIANEWHDICSYFDDGRQFRDALWGYEKVIALADKEVLELWASLENEP